MSTPFDIVKDSSVWYNSISLSAVSQLDSVLYTGTVRSVFNDSETGELRYMVEVHYRGDTIPVACRMVRRFGGVFNYEDIILRGYSYKTPAGIAAKTGDQVLVGLLGGQGREGVILGGLTHPTRKNLSVTNGPEFKSEFNGIETYINKDGEYMLTFKAQPTNLSALDQDSGGPAPTPEYDVEIGSSYLKWDKTGSFTINDNAKEDPQTLFMDKTNGLFNITSGKVSLSLSKKDQSATLTSTDIKLGGTDVKEQAVLGTTYREKESKMNSDLQMTLKLMKTFLDTAGTLMDTAGTDPVWAGLCPGAAASTKAAAALVKQAAAQAEKLANTIKTFESSADKYLSKVVKVG